MVIYGKVQQTCLDGFFQYWSIHCRMNCPSRVLVHSNDMDQTSLYLLNLILGCESYPPIYSTETKETFNRPTKTILPTAPNNTNINDFAHIPLGRYPKLPRKKERLPKHKLLVKHPGVSSRGMWVHQLPTAAQAANMAGGVSKSDAESWRKDSLDGQVAGFINNPKN